jgi:hypothetical protein
VSTDFQPLEIPAGVIAKPTKKMKSSNWAEVNLMRWTEGQIAPVGGQAQYNYTFASNCRKIHGWYDLAGTYRICYLCEKNIYLDTGGVLTEITPSGGLSGPVFALGGYGDLTYNLDTYGTARAINQNTPRTKMPDAYSMDNFGAILLVMTSSDSRLLMWDPAAGGLMTQVAGSPTGRLMVVTQERFVIIFGLVDTTGAGFFYRWGWSDQENYANWAFSDVSSKAGFYDMQPSSPFVAAKAGKYGVVFFTAKQTFVATYSGLPYIYGYVQIADNCTPWSPQSIASTSGQTLWMSQQGLWSFDGTNVSPLGCAVRPWIDDDIDLGQVREVAFAVHASRFNEFWWFFPQNGNNYNTRCVIYNYKEGWWSQGRMQRSAGMTASFTSYTIMANNTVAYQHELGSFYGNADLPWAETYDLNLTNGSKLVTVKQLLPDIEGSISAITYSLFYRNSRALGTPEQQTPQLVIRPDGYVDCRTTGRDVRLRLQAQGPNVLPFVIGQHQIDIVVRGQR